MANSSSASVHNSLTTSSTVNCDLNYHDDPHENVTTSAAPTATTKPPNDQFKATKMWNEVLHSFYLGIQLKKHRRQMKSYYDCFTASEAITWLKNYLKNNPRFGNKVTRFQALNLLRKYHKSNIIERINLNKNDNELKDNNELYRFTVDANENLPFLITSKSEADLLKSCALENFRPIELDVREKIDIYKQTIWTHLNRSLYNISDYIKQDQIDGSALLNNVTKINSNGVVQLIDKSEDLPNWILSAMKCLANWPKASGSGNCLPKYPGFEYDVFKLIRDYFTNMEEPIIPYKYYRLLMDVHDFYMKASMNHQKNVDCSNNISAKIYDLENNNSSNSKHIINADELGLPANCVYETVFSEKEPITKIVPIDELSNVFPSLIDYFKQININETNASNAAFVNISQQFQTPPQIAASKQNFSNTFQALSTIPRNSRWKRSMTMDNCHSRSTTPLTNNILTTKQMNQKLSFESPPESGEYMLDKNVSFKRFYSLRRNHKNHQPQENGIVNNIKCQLSNLQRIEPVDSAGFVDRLTANNQKRQYYHLLQLILLLLPNSNRRHLQLLIRMFYKIINNKELCLLTKDSLTLKEHIVDIFTRCIICSQQEKDFNEFRSKEFVAFLIDECMDVFNVPEDYQQDVEKKMDELKNQKNELRFNEHLGTNGTTNNDYCQKITNEEYELQRDALSDAALSDLLHSIMRDDSLSQRDKLKWIKQFKMYHPDVYDVYNCINNLNNNENVNPGDNSAQKQKQQQQLNCQRQHRSFSLGSNKSTTFGTNVKHKKHLFKRFLSLKL